MLPFFRKIRWRLAQDNQFWKYSRYAIGEIVLVVIGILIALQVNSWNQDRINNNIQKQYLHRIQRDIKKDLEKLRFLKNRHQERIIKVNKFIDYFGEKQIDQDTFNDLFWSIHYPDDFIETNDTYNDMVNSAKLDLISSDSLKIKIIELYSHYDALNQYENHIAMDNRENIYSLSIRLFDWEVLANENDLDAFNREFQKISSSLQLKNAFVLFRSVAPKLTDLYNTGIIKIEEIDGAISKELDRE